MKIKYSHFPLSLRAFTRSELELTIEVENDDDQAYWIEADITLQNGLSLAPDSSLQKGRTRLGIVKEGEIKSKKLKIFSKTDPGEYNITLAVYAFDRDAVIANRQDKEIVLRSERL